MRKRHFTKNIRKIVKQPFFIHQCVDEAHFENEATEAILEVVVEDVVDIWEVAMVEIVEENIDSDQSKSLSKKESSSNSRGGKEKVVDRK